MGFFRPSAFLTSIFREGAVLFRIQFRNALSVLCEVILAMLFEVIATGLLGNVYVVNDSVISGVEMGLICRYTTMNRWNSEGINKILELHIIYTLSLMVLVNGSGTLHNAFKSCLNGQIRFENSS